MGLQCVFFLRGVIHVCLGVQGMHTYMEGSRCMHALGRGSRCLGECVGGWSKCLGGVQVPGGCPCVWVKSHILGGSYVISPLNPSLFTLCSPPTPTIVSREANLKHPSEDSRRLHHDEGRWVDPRLGSMSSCCPGLSVGPGGGPGWGARPGADATVSITGCGLWF